MPTLRKRKLSQKTRARPASSTHEMALEHDTMHHGFVCDGCNNGIQGVLWHCHECGDDPSTSYDLCQLCYDGGEFARHQQGTISTEDDELVHNVVPIRIPAHILHEACTDGNLLTVKKILEQEDSKINMKMNGSTPLAKAVVFYHPDIVDLLLSHPEIDPNTVITEMSQRPLEYAIHNGDEEMALKLLAHPRIEICRPLGYVTCFHDAARSGLVSVFDALLTHPDADLSGADGDGVTVLHAACHLEGDISIVNKILKAAAHDIDVQDASGLTPLLWAVHSERQDLVEILLEAGADVGVPTNEGSNPFHAAVSNNNIEITRLLSKFVTKTRASFSPLYARDRFEHTPMYYAVAHERPQLVKVLLDAGYDVNHKEKDSERLLHISVRSQDVAMTELLLNNGADCNATNTQYHTPLHVAVFYIVDWRVFHQILLLFLVHKVNLDLKGITNPRLMVYEAALNMALTLRKPNVAGLLVRYGCQPSSVRTFATTNSINLHSSVDINVDDSYGEDAMIQSLGLGENDLCEMLFAAGANTKKLLKTISVYEKHKSTSTALQSAMPFMDLETEKLVALVSRPRTLSSLCRLTVRRTLNDFRPESLRCLRIPSKLTDYLLFSDFSHVWEEIDEEH